MGKEFEAMIRKNGLGHGFLNKRKNPFRAGCSSVFDLFGSQKGFNLKAFRENRQRRNARNTIEYDFLTTAKDLFLDDRR
jgi:hypothetical protein